MSHVDLFPLMIVAGIAGVFAIIIALVVQQGRKNWERVQRLATELGLEMEARKKVLGITYGLPRASGTWRGWRMEIFNYTTGSGKTQRTWSTMALHLNGPPTRSFKLRPQNFGTTVSKLFGAREIIVGSREFDDAFFVEAGEAEFFKAALLPEIQAKLLEARRAGAKGTYECAAGSLKYTEQNAFSAERVQRFRALTEVLADLATLAETGSR